MMPREGKRIAPAEFRRLWLDPSVRVDDLATMLGVTRQAVQQRARARGLSPRPMGRLKQTAINDPEFPAMWTAGIRAREIAAHYGCHRLTVCKTARRLGLPPRGKQWGPRMNMATYRQLQLAQRMAVVAKVESAAARRSVWAA